MILKSRLESEGIQCNLKDQYTSEVLTHIPSMSVKLQVYESDLDKVKELMNEIGQPIGQIPDIQCPNCKSENLVLELNFSDRLNIFLNYIKTQLFFSQSGNPISRSFLCNNCGEKFSM